ncbi:HAMP domain-containing protein [Maribrevibacterium harenarium]|uniref:C4-dicarboxylate transport sensor protein DctB n=1 Tax=Maribrevibacterium harenarium TaxID=2589817 RepID=A0A501WJ77_9GAMM|nr:ATP-binding protein [Maribrevibacterium harenarium]TPE45666.1 HAMP domain-containing protein [Maribrevibacterium harenarium]
MGLSLRHWIRHIGIGGRLFLAFALISSITFVASGLTTNTYVQLRDELLLLQHQDIPGLDAAARLNDKSRLIVSTAPLLVSSESNASRLRAMDELNSAIEEMDNLMRNLPDYNRYFVELITQIHNSLTLLNQNVEQREQVHNQLIQTLLQVFPRIEQLINEFEQRPAADALPIISRLYYFYGMAEKIRNDASFNDLDYTFLHLEHLGSELEASAKTLGISATTHADLDDLINIGSRKGELFILKNLELDLLYQQSFYLQNSQNHIQQLAAQINQYTNQTNTSIGTSLNNAIKSINISIRSVLLLSLISLIVAGAVSWFYVQRNVLQRIQELQQNMRAIANSKLDTQIRIIGDDEVSNMARDLRHFQKTAIQVEQTNLKLAAEVEERIAAEAQLKATQNELVQAGKLAALGQLSVGITHEINQPLTAIASHLHILERRLDKDEPEKAREALSKISRLIDKTAAITRHLKTFARVAKTELSPVSVNAVIQDTIDLMSNRLREHPCQFEYTPISSTVTVLAEPIRLEQVLVNLLSNALDALTHSVQEPSEQKVRVIVHDCETQVEIRVEDTGRGIEPDKLELIFDPFYTQKEVGQGLGLGLSISYNIIQDFGGRIRVHSTLGKGSCFTLILNKAEQ